MKMLKKLEIIYKELYDEDYDEGNPVTRDSKHHRFDLLVLLLSLQLKGANSALEVLRDHHAQIRRVDQSRRLNSNRRILHKYIIAALNASGQIDIGAGREKARTSLNNAISACAHIETMRYLVSDLGSRIDALNPQGTDAFKQKFDNDFISYINVINFEIRDEAGNPATTEGRLRRKVLEIVNSNGGRCVSASGKQRGAAHGMGGVGKTTALRVLCRDEQVIQAYGDGICFLEFGQDADGRKLIAQVARCVGFFGGEKWRKK